MATVTVKLTANFERNLEEVEVFLGRVNAAQVYDQLLEELICTLIPNLERFPAIGRPFHQRKAGSAEFANALQHLKLKLADGELREYLFEDYLVLYAQFGDVIHLLSIRHFRQLSFDFQSFWP